MTHCPTCHKEFEEEGFCPFDQTALVPGKVAIGTGSSDAAPDGTPSHEVKAVSAQGHGPEFIANLLNYDPAQEYEQLVGTTLGGRYKIEQKLGEGGMGVVYLARHEIIEKYFAVKVLKREVARDHSVVKRFVQEAKAASRIGHPNIIDVTDFGTTPDGMTYSVMEFLQGSTLNTVFARDGAFPVPRAIHIVEQIARAVGAAHQKGIVHRDLKPENIFLLRRGEDQDFVKIVDFGIAKVAPLDGGEGQRLTRAGTVFGTPEYMAPEQAAGRADIDGRCDIYALGTILYELLVGKVPHSGSSTVRTLAMQMLDPIIPPRKAKPELPINDEFEQAMLKALAKKIEDRYATMHDFLQDLENAAMDQILGNELFKRPSPIPAVSAGPEQRTLAPNDSATLPEEFPAAPVGTFDQSDSQRTPQWEDSRPVELVPPNRWPLIVGVLVTVTLVAGITYALFRTPDQAPVLAVSSDAATQPTPLVTNASPPPDANDEHQVQPDTGTTATTTENPTNTKAPNSSLGAGSHKNSKTPSKVIPRKLPTHTVLVITKPENASLYVDGGYRGTGESRFTRAQGTKIRVTCKLPGYKPGRVTLLFDGKRDVYMCTMKRIKRCIEGIHNPFDDCPDP